MEVNRLSIKFGIKSNLDKLTNRELSQMKFESNENEFIFVLNETF